MLKCQFGGRPAPLIKWEKRNGKIPTTAVETSDGTLRIPDLTRNDQGVYTCTASNKAGLLSGQVSLKIRQRPRLIVKPENKTVKVGEEVQFQWLVVLMFNT